MAYAYQSNLRMLVHYTSVIAAAVICSWHENLTLKILAALSVNQVF